jgi:hypothetical protein
MAIRVILSGARLGPRRSKDLWGKRREGPASLTASISKRSRLETTITNQALVIPSICPENPAIKGDLKTTKFPEGTKENSPGWSAAESWESQTTSAEVPEGRPN